MYLLLQVLSKLAPILTIFAIALLLVYSINPVVNFLIKNKFKPLWAAIATSLMIALALFAFFYLLIPGLVREVRQLSVFISAEFLQDTSELLQKLVDFDTRFNLGLAENFIQYYTTYIEQVPSMIQSFLPRLASIPTYLVTQIWVILGLIFLVFYLVQDLENAKAGLTRLFPQIYHQRIAHILGIVDEKVGAYIRGTLLKSLIVGLLTGLGLAVMGMPFALLLGILAGVLNIILYVGPVLAALPSLLLSLGPDTPNFFLVLGLYIVVQVIDSFVSTPMLLGKAVDLSPLTIVAVVLIGSRLLGVLGIILAIPISAILKVIVAHYYLEKNT